MRKRAQACDIDRMVYLVTIVAVDPDIEACACRRGIVTGIELNVRFAVMHIGAVVVDIVAREREIARTPAPMDGSGIVVNRGAVRIFQIDCIRLRSIRFI